MKKQLTIAALGLGLASAAFAQDKPAAPAEAKAPVAEKEVKLDATQVTNFSSYGIGYQSAMQLSGAGITPADLNKEAFMKGFLTALEGAEPDFTAEQFEAAMKGLNEVVTKREEKVAADNLAKETAFLAENAKKEGVTTTDSGLQYKIIKKGEGKTYEAPKDAPNGMDMTSEFNISYKGKLTDGTEFDASPEGETVPFTLQVVPGFAEALKMMPIGSTWQLVIPSKLGYGDRRNGPKLAPNSTLIFEVSLKSIGSRPAPQGFPGFPQGGPAPR